MLSFILVLSFSTVSSLSGSDLFLKADQAQRSGNYETASRLFMECSQSSETLAPYALSRAGEAAAKQGKAQEAAALFGRVLKEYPQGPWVRLTYMRLGRLHQSLKDTEKSFVCFQQVFNGIEPLPWFLNGLRKTYAETALELPLHVQEGYDWFRHVASTTIYTAERTVAARMLIKAPRQEDRLWGIYGLVRSGELQEGRRALEAESLTMKDSDGRTVSLQSLDAQLMDGQRNLLEWAASLKDKAHHNRDNLGLRLWFMLSLREQAKAERFGAAEVLADLLTHFFPEGRDAGDGWWLLSERYEKRADYSAADRMYHALARRCIDHVRAPRSLFNLGNRARLNKEYSTALALFAQLNDAFPGGQFAAESLYCCAQIEKERRDAAGELRYLKLAAAVGPGHYFAHRAYYLLGGKDKSVVLPDRRLRVAGTEDFIAALPYEEEKGVALSFLIQENPIYERIVFFGIHGLEEGEWECLDCLHTIPDSLKKAWYPVLAEAGFGHTTLQHAVSEQWGMEGGIPSPERRRLEYPLAYWNTVKKTADDNKVDPYLVLAIARQESTFRSGIVSSAGATGVLQMMPATARWLGDVDTRITAGHVANLKSPLNSIALGTVYIQRMLSRSQDNAVYALASYNAGPGNCDKWRKQFPNVSLESFMEKIPFSETNDYVKRVLGNYGAYHSLYPAPKAVTPAIAHTP